MEVKEVPPVESVGERLIEAGQVNMGKGMESFVKTKLRRLIFNLRTVGNY